MTHNLQTNQPPEGEIAENGTPSGTYSGGNSEQPPEPFVHDLFLGEYFFALRTSRLLFDLAVAEGMSLRDFYSVVNATRRDERISSRFGSKLTAEPVDPVAKGVGMFSLPSGPRNIFVKFSAFKRLFGKAIKLTGGGKNV